MQQEDLIVLSVRVLERNKGNPQGNLPATNVLRNEATKHDSMIDTPSGNSCQVALPRGSNLATKELHALIEEVSKNYGGHDPQFLEEYIEEVMTEWLNDLDKVLACFRDLAKQKPPVNNRT